MTNDPVDQACSLLAGAIIRNPSEHYPSPRALVTIDGLRVSLHRVLYEKTRGEPPLALRKVCAYPNCKNPFHYEDRWTPSLVPRKFCPNNHPYTQVDILPSGRYRCSVCYANRLARRRNGRPSRSELNRLTTMCPRYHEYTPGNTYLWRDAKGSMHRKCKTCSRERNVGRP